MRKYLIKTEGTTLVYCDPSDKLLGIGMDRYNPFFKNKEDWGENRLGQVMMQVRDQIITNPAHEEEVKVARQEVQETKAKKKYLK